VNLSILEEATPVPPSQQFFAVRILWKRGSSAEQTFKSRRRNKRNNLQSALLQTEREAPPQDFALRFVRGADGPDLALAGDEDDPPMQAVVGHKTNKNRGGSNGGSYE